MWNLYGKKYDLTAFAKFHPGGAEIIERTKGLDDCTVLFESYHAFSDLSSIKQSLEKYAIHTDDDTVIVSNYDTDFTTYHNLVEKVKEIFPDRASIKAPPSWYLFVSVLGFSYIYTLYHMIFVNHNIAIKCLLAIVLGLCDSTILFNILHDGSHYAIDTQPLVNTTVSKITNAWHLWNHDMWLFHHLYYHHSFTGSVIDPDQNLYNNLQNLSTMVVNTLYAIFPGQYITQIIWYIISAKTYNLYTVYSLFGKSNSIPIPSTIEYYDPVSVSIMLLKLFVIYNYGIIPLILYFISCNTFYYINVACDHDLYQTYENHYDGPDWAKRQICNSGNFANAYPWWGMIFGGINYQIEHHLFPNMSNHHYPVVAHIVKKFCKENNMPYSHEPTLKGAYHSFMKRITVKKES